ncbi:FkbM family methyltransferase [Mesorhizobium sp. M0933]|uniref:FkbM family methyltransferase n=1 Tax=Mesorhizobium sp. M0933 TaxID=2957030 RepID=UPI003339BD77
MLRYFAWQIRSRFQEKVKVRWVDGSNLVVRAGMTGATGNVYCGLHEFPEMGFLLHVLRSGDLFCDIGANVGSYTILASAVVGAETIAFEPVAETVRRLFDNIHANLISPLVTVHVVVLGAQDGTINFTVGHDTMNHVATAKDQLSQPFPMRSLDTVLCGRCPVFLKIDVEGYEKEVFSGAQKTLENPSLSAISTELFTPAMSEMLGRVGFRRFHYDPYSRALTTHKNSWNHSNALLVRDFDLVQQRLKSAPSFKVFGTEI